MDSEVTAVCCWIVCVVGVVDEAVVVVSAVVLSEVVGTTVEVRVVDSEVTAVDVVGSLLLMKLYVVVLLLYF